VDPVFPSLHLNQDETTSSPASKAKAFIPSAKQRSLLHLLHLLLLQPKTAAQEVVVIWLLR